MPNAPLLRQRLAALFLVGVLLWFSPWLGRLEQAGSWLGVPLIYIYLYGVWALLILVAAVVVGHRRD
jgi:hypothetical protein